MHRILTCLAVAFLALAGCDRPGVAGNSSIPLTVAESAGVDRVGAPVTTGVPFAQGVVAKGSSFALTDAAGKAVPLQTRVLAHWPDGSVKWVLVDFQAENLKASGSATYTLHPGPAAMAAAPPTVSPAMGGPRVITVKQSPDAITIDTGAALFKLNAKKFDLFSSVVVEGKEQLAGPVGGLSITDVAGKTRTSQTDLADGYRLEVVEAGPLRTVVRATGEMQANDKYKLGFTCWYHFYAGRRDARVYFTVRNLDGKTFTATDQRSWQDAARARELAKVEGNVEVKDVSLLLPLSKQAGAAALIGGDPSVGAHELAAGKLYQDSSAGWMWQGGDGKLVDPAIKANAEWMKKNAPAEARDKAFWEFEPSLYAALTNTQSYVGCNFRGYKLYDAAGKELLQADRAAGWVQVGPTTVALRWLWQMYPKAIEVSADGRLRMGLWPHEWSDHSYNHVFVGHVHKTHELLFSFGGPTGAKSGEADSARFNAPLMAVAPKEYYCATGAFNTFLMPENRKDFARYEDWALTAVKEGVNPNVNIARDSSLRIEREKMDYFGVWHFGDTSKRGWRGFGQYMELDIPYCLVANWARTNNRAFFDEAELCVRELMDVPAHGGGYGHQKGESSHYYTSGSLFFYYLTGLDFIRDSIRTSHDDFAKVAPWHMRSFAITMWSNLDMIREFGDEQYVANVRNDLAWFKGDPKRPAQDPATGFRGYGQPNFQEFMLGMGVDSLGQYCTMFPDDQEARDRLVALMMATMRTHELGSLGFKAKADANDKDAGKGWKQNNSCCNANTWAYLFTGDDKFLDFACKLLDESLQPGNKEWPIYRTGTGAGKYWSEFGMRDSQTHMWARWYRMIHGTPKPAAAIADLAATVEGDTVTLTWTAPTGGVAGASSVKFFAKLADKPLANEVKTDEEGKTLANWWMTPIAGELAIQPGAAGGRMSMTLKLPTGAKLKYAAVRSAAQVGPITAISDLSNVVEIK
ncbi:MAG: hypothetical protein BIFFINMI_01861 [Phycisphaerae bacterium]|nr:hypothetical protein [Phycisphaerae bacterium]